jgi:hypothetical protein
MNSQAMEDRLQKNQERIKDMRNTDIGEKDESEG